MSAGAGRVLILSADVGDGHLAAANAIAEGLQRLGADVVACDGLAALGRVARYIIRDAYRLQLRVAPWSYGAMYALFNRVPLARRAGEALLSALGRRRLLAIVAAADPAVVVSTHPALTCVLGRARRRRRLGVPVAVTITDMADYSVWSHPGADVHLVMHAHGLAPVERLAGAGSAALVEPIVSRRFRAPRDPDAARDALGLRRDGTLVAVTGGGWGVGDLAGAVAAALAAGADAIVAVAGRNARAEDDLRARFGADPRVRVWGFTARMDDLLRAADAVVHSTGGVTSLEALCCGCPMIAYGTAIGHIGVHNRTMAALGLIEVAPTRTDLTRLLRDVLASSPPAWTPAAGAREPAAVVLATRPRVRPLPVWRLAAARATPAIATFAALFAGLATDDAYSVAARPLELRATSHVATARPLVAVVVRGAGAQIPALAPRLRASGVRVSFAVAARGRAGAAAEASVEAAARAGAETVPELETGAPVGWLLTRGALAHAPPLDGRRCYLVPPGGLSLGQYLLARSIHATPVTARERLDAAASGPPPSAGDIVVVAAGGSTGRTASAVVALSMRLARRGLRITSLSGLLASASTNERTTGERSSASAPPATTASPAATPSG